MAEFQEFPKMLYHGKKAPQVANDAEHEAKLKGQGFNNQAPAQFPEESEADASADPVAHQNADPLREAAIVSQIDQEKTRLAGNQGAKDPATLDDDNEDEASMLAGREPKPAAVTGKGKGK